MSRPAHAMRVPIWPKVLTVLAMSSLAAGHLWGLYWAPAERYMGDIGRILYAHMPVAMMSLFVCTLSFIGSLGYLLSSESKPKWGWDSFSAAAAEVAAVFCAMALITGSIWSKPTWGTYWEWDPRLTSMLILFFSYIGLLTLRSFLDEPERRATWSAVVGIMTAINVPIVYFSVQWWNSIHQVQSTPDTISSPMLIPLRLSLTGAFLLVWGWTLWRSQHIRHRLQQELTPLPASSTSKSSGILMTPIGDR